MIIGNGMLAKAFSLYTNNHNIVIFASGVSNSKESDPDEFKREKNLLCKELMLNKDKLFIYFSTCSIIDASTTQSFYVSHKILMENLVKEHPKYYIFRLPQVVGITKSPTLVNFLTNSIVMKQSFHLQNKAVRNLIDVEDVVKITNKIIEKNIYLNETTNIASPYNYSVLKIVSILENIIGEKAYYELIQAGEEQKINIEKIKNLQYNFQDNYVFEVLEKYTKIKLEK